MTILYDVQGGDRKRLAEALGNITLWNPVYAGTPSFAYTVGNYKIDKKGTVFCPSLATWDIVNQIIEKLKEKGFAPVSVVGDAITISLPANLFNSDSLDRLREIIGSKAELFKRAFRTDNVSFDIVDEELCFPWFYSHGIDGEVDAYNHFICALGKMARERQRITAKSYSGDNDKFTMRLFLVQLGLKGPKFKQTRKILLRNLTGNSAWQNPLSTQNNAR